MPIDSKYLLGQAIRYLSEAAKQRAAGGWVPPKEEERRRREASRQEQVQQKQFIADEKEREKNLAAFQKGNHPDVPHVVYHGTTGDFSEFLNKMAGSSTGAKSAKLGHWFTDNPDVAKTYADYSATIAPVQSMMKEAEKYRAKEDWDNYDKLMENAEKLEDSFRDIENRKRGQNIMPAHLSMKNPYVIDANGENYASIEGGLTKQIQLAKFKGHDGVIVKNLDDAAGLSDVPANHYIVFNPTQIKSATGNQGTFDPSEPDITKSEGGPILSKQYPTHYMPNVGRQVMQGGGVPDQPQRQLSPMGFYSAAAERAQTLQPSGDAVQMVNALKNTQGIKTEELMNAGLIDAAGNVHPEWAGRGKVTREDLVSHLQGQMPQIEETVLGGETPRIKELKNQMSQMAENDPRYFNLEQELLFEQTNSGTKYKNYTLPGGENYREVLLKLPKQSKLNKNESAELAEMRQREPLGQIRSDEVKRFQQLIDKERDAPQQFKSHHWDDPNVIAHIRMADRTGPNGEKILHVEELQSDWGQKGKKEGFNDQSVENKIKGLQEHLAETEKEAAFYTDQGKDAPPEVIDRWTITKHALRELENKKYSMVPSAPYVTSTEGWTDLALKRVLKEAAEGGYDKVVWTPGAEQAKRYDLSKQIDSLKYSPAITSDKTGKSYGGNLVAYKDGHVIFNKEVKSSDELEGMIGKDVANKLLQTEKQKGESDFRPYHYLEGSDLSVGGEGMKGYYDSIVPKRLQNLAKKYDKNAKVGYHNISDKYHVVSPNGQNITAEPVDSEEHASDLIRTLGRNNPLDLSVKKVAFQMPGLEITPTMRESILRGQSAYKRGGAVSKRHPALSIAGVHIREEEHGEPIFTGRL